LHFNLIKLLFDTKNSFILTGVQIQKLELLYEELIAGSELMLELEAIVRYAVPKIKSTIDIGTEIYSNVEALKA
jgi:hypothetical protein